MDSPIIFGSLIFKRHLVAFVSYKELYQIY